MDSELKFEFNSKHTIILYNIVSSLLDAGAINDDDLVHVIEIQKLMAGKLKPHIDKLKVYIEPHMKPNDKIMFCKYIDNATNYFEYGSGGSTYECMKRQNIKSITSIESDIEWYNKIKEDLDLSQNNIIYCNMNCEKNNWGRPGSDSTLSDWQNYSNQILKTDINIDLILIDGRFRTACCLKCFNIINDDCIILFDDFLDREEDYGIVLDYYEVIENTSDNCMVVLKKKNCESPPIKLIEKYEKDFK